MTLTEAALQEAIRFYTEWAAARRERGEEALALWAEARVARLKAKLAAREVERMKAESALQK